MRNIIATAGLLVSMAFAFIALGQEPQSSDKLEPPKLKNKSLVYVYSYKHIKTLGRVAPPVYLDGKVLAKLDGAKFFIVQPEQRPRKSYYKA